jgi:hypothetical protein
MKKIEKPIKLSIDSPIDLFPNKSAQTKQQKIYSSIFRNKSEESGSSQVAYSIKSITSEDAKNFLRINDINELTNALIFGDGIEINYVLEEHIKKVYKNESQVRVIMTNQDKLCNILKRKKDPIKKQEIIAFLELTTDYLAKNTPDYLDQILSFDLKSLSKSYLLAPSCHHLYNHLADIANHHLYNHLEDISKNNQYFYLRYICKVNIVLNFTAKVNESLDKKLTSLLKYYQKQEDNPMNNDAILIETVSNSLKQLIYRDEVKDQYVSLEPKIKKHIDELGSFYSKQLRKIPIDELGSFYSTQLRKIPNVQKNPSTDTFDIIPEMSDENYATNQLVERVPSDEVEQCIKDTQKVIDLKFRIISKHTLMRAIEGFFTKHDGVEEYTKMYNIETANVRSAIETYTQELKQIHDKYSLESNAGAKLISEMTKENVDAVDKELRDELILDMESLALNSGFGSSDRNDVEMYDSFVDQLFEEYKPSEDTIENMISVSGDAV